MRARIRASFRRYASEPERVLSALAEPVREFAIGLKRLGVPLETAIASLRECVRDSRPTLPTAHALVRARTRANRWVQEAYSQSDR